MEPDETMPFDQDAALPEQEPMVLGGEEFLCDGRGLSADEFGEYVRGYNFGGNPPDFVVLHHTGSPTMVHAPADKAWLWDDDVAGRSHEQIFTKRQHSFGRLRDFYHNQCGWTKGPHLFIDDRFIWLMTPMYYDGIHARCGNLTYDSNGTMHYSVGIEVVGNYDRVNWPEPVAGLVGHAVAVLKRQLGTFELSYSYADGLIPGHVARDGKDLCARPERVRWGGISSHRDYNKPWCPGKQISEAFYMQVIHDGWNRLQQASTPTVGAQRIAASTPAAQFSADQPLLGVESCGQAQVVEFIQARLPATSEYINDVALIIGYYWTHALLVGLDPFVAAAQCVFETDALRSSWAGRPRRNPAGMGVDQEGGLSFESWEVAVQAHLGQLLAVVLRDDEANHDQLAMMVRNPRHGQIAPELRGSAKTIAGIGAAWGRSPDYAKKLLARMQAIAAPAPD